MKEIHFYTNLSNIDQVSDWDLDNMCTDWVSTYDAIYKRNDEIVKTTQLSFLRDTWDLIRNGSKVFIHNQMDVIEIEEHMHAPDGREIRAGHDISRILIGGGFGKLG